MVEFGDIKAMTVTAPHPFHGKTFYFATKHGKEELLKPLLAELGMDCIAIPVNTDEFGTFSGEVERTGSVRETLRKKIKEQRPRPDGQREIDTSECEFCNP